MKTKGETEGETIIIEITMIQIESTRIKSTEISLNTIKTRMELKANKSVNTSQKSIMSKGIIRNSKNMSVRIIKSSRTTIKEKETSHLRTGSSMGKKAREATLLLIKVTKKFNKK